MSTTKLDRGALAAEAQDAFNYLLSAGGSTLEHKYGYESQLSQHRTLAERIEHLELGREKLGEMVDLIHEQLRRPIPTSAISFGRRDVRSEADLVKYARKAIKMVLQICKRYKVDAYTGYTDEHPDSTKSYRARYK